MTEPGAPPPAAAAVRAALGPERLGALEETARRLAASLPGRLLFTVTPGRSGTGALAHLLRCLPGVYAAHEPRPSFADALRAANLGHGAALEFWVRRKLPALGRVRAAVYAETSHMACLGFLGELTLSGVPFELVSLERPARAVATSLWKLDTIPGRTLRGLRYYLSPRDPVLRPLASEALHGLHDYQLCYWYALEIEARQARWIERQEAGGPRVHRLRTDELEGPGAIERVAARLELPRPGALASLRSRLAAPRHRNAKQAKKLPRAAAPEDLERLEREVRALSGAAAATPRPPTSVR